MDRLEPAEANGPRVGASASRAGRQGEAPQGMDSRACARSLVRRHRRPYGIHGEYAFIAEAAGASSATVFDVGDAELSEFPKLKRERGSNIRYVQGNLEDPVSVERIGPHEVVWCTGVLYHTPNSVLQLLALREMTRELLYLGTHTIPRPRASSRPASITRT